MTDRYIRRGTARAYWATTIANPAAPTVAEITAGTDLTRDLEQLTNFTPTVETISYNVASSPFTRQTPGRLSAAPQLLTFYENRIDNNAAERAALAQGAAGYVVLCPDGEPSPGDRVEVWPARAGGPANIWSGDTTAARWQCQIFPTGTPTTNGVIS